MNGSITCNDGVRRAPGLISSAFIWAILYIVALFALKHADLPRSAAVATALLPIPAFVVFLWQFIRYVRDTDELERRIQLEALAIAFPVTIVLLMLLGLLDLAVPLDRAEWSYRNVWTILPAIYFCSVALAWRRYR